VKSLSTSPLLLVAAFAAVATLSARRAVAEATCLNLRPTNPAADWSYAGAQVGSFATAQGNVRVWFTTEGPHAPSIEAGTSTPMAAVVAGAAAEEALLSFESLGFRKPASDAGSPCVDHGGDARLDVYLLDFHGADGTVVADACEGNAPATCSGFVLVENDFDGAAYASAEEGFRTVVPHELFHLVQYAYSADSEAWWAEGSAQWAAKRVYPELGDFERFLPAFFRHPERALGSPATVAVAAFNYGAAIWPSFLAERFGDDVLLDIFDELSRHGETGPLQATDTALARRESSLSGAFAEFAAYNGATGTRAASNGYARAASYPEVPLQPLPLNEPATGKLAGLAARYFAVEGEGPRELVLSGDPARVGATYLPLVAGAVDLSRAAPLPLRAAAPGLVVMTGRAVDFRDVPFSVLSSTVDDEAIAGAPASSGGAPISEEPTDTVARDPFDGGAAGADAAPTPSAGGTTGARDCGVGGESALPEASPPPSAVGGCSFGAPRELKHAAASLVALALTSLFRRRKTRPRPCRSLS
jgi:hypothetical protein